MRFPFKRQTYLWYLDKYIAEYGFTHFELSKVGDSWQASNGIDRPRHYGRTPWEALNAMTEWFDANPEAER